MSNERRTSRTRSLDEILNNRTMAHYPPSENGVKVNMIKQKFERNVLQKEQHREVEELKDSLRRSLSASPVKSKRNLKLSVSRQLSNPGKNIKRTPAFRGDKSSRTKNLQSPTKEKFVSIVDRNVKMFEDKPEYGKIGNVKKKWNEDVVDGSEAKNIGWQCAREETQETGENRVRTTVISRQKDISPIYKRDYRFTTSNESIVNSPSRESEIFLKNGVEYTRVRKQKCPFLFPELDDAFGNEDDNLGLRGEELSKRIGGKREEEEKDEENNYEHDEIVEKNNEESNFTEQDPTLRAALRAPLPSGPPPKKPPRTFAHGRCESKIGPTEFVEEKVRKIDIPTSNCTKNSERDSKRMLEKLEHVLIQHQRALGPKVIIPRKEKNERETRGLSRTLEDSKKFRSQPGDAKSSKLSTNFDRWPSLNCATRSNHERVKDPNFESYIAENWSTRESNITVSRSEDFIKNSTTSLVLGNSEFYNDINKSPEISSTDSSGFHSRRAKPNEERVYAEPFAFDKNSGTDITGHGILTPEEHNYFSRSLEKEKFGSNEWNRSPIPKLELHYMCTSIEPLVYEDNNNIAENNFGSSKTHRTTEVTKNLLLQMNDHTERMESNKYDKIKVEQLLNRAFGKFVMAGAETPSDSNASSDTDSLASSASMSDEFSSFNEKLQLFKNRENTTRPSSKDELRRSLTEKRKNYVRRVSSKYSEKRDGANLVDRRDRSFQVCLLVELNLSTREPYVKDKYPVYAKTPAWIENFCFPDAMDWPSNGHSSQNQFYSLALMDERGNRRYGYCCRVRPEDGPILPLAYCLITKYRASGFYRKLLLELEARHGLPDKQRRNFIEELYNSPMPKPGESLYTTIDNVGQEFLSTATATTTTTTQPIDNKPCNNNFVLSKLIDSSDKSAIYKMEQSNGMSKQDGNPNDSDTMENVITRSGDPRLEERDMCQLFDAVTNKVLVILFASLLLERKVVLLCDKLGKLSSCVEALESLLYPFTWPHTFIPVLPDIPGLSEILEAPLPFVIGIFKSKNSASTEIPSVRDGIVVDLDTSKIVCAVGDESSILPSRLQKRIRSALQLVSSNTKSGDGIRNFLVSEAFLRAFVETCSHYDSHLVTQQDGKIIFQKESFVKATSSKTEQYFLEWFVETTMFAAFVQERIERIEKGSGSCETDDDMKLFDQRVAEYRRVSEKSAQTKKGCSKKKTLGDRLKDLTNFHA